MAHHDSATSALVKIKEEPFWEERGVSLAHLGSSCPDMMEIEAMVNEANGGPSLMANPMRAYRARAPAVESIDAFAAPDEIVNSDEEQSRAARRAAYLKVTNAGTKRARRKLNPPDEWKRAVPRDNVEHLSSNDMMRAPIEFITAGDGLNTVYKDGVLTVASAERVPAARKRGGSNPPLETQPLYVSQPPVLRKEVARRLGDVERARATGVGTVAVYAANQPVRQNVSMVAEELLQDLPVEDVKKGIVVPTMRELSSMTVDMNDMMLRGRTDEQGMMLSQLYMQNPVSSLADQNFVFRELRRTSLHGCPISHVGAMDYYYAMMTANMRSVDESVMRTPFPNERPCIEENACMGRHIPHSTPVTLVEYITMEDMAHFRATGAWKGKRRHCVLCRRMLATKAAYSIIAECAAYSNSMVSNVKISREAPFENERRALMLVDFYNFIGTDEYSPFDVMMSHVNRHIGIVAPVALFVASRFKQVNRDGVYWYIQDYTRPKRDLREWVTLVCGGSLSGTPMPRAPATTVRPRRTNKFFIPRPLFAPSKEN